MIIIIYILGVGLILGNIQTYNTYYAVFLDKNYYNQNNVKSYITQSNTQHLFYLNFSPSAYFSECIKGNNNFRTYGLYNFCSAPLYSSNNNLNIDTNIPVIYRNSSFNSILLSSPVSPYFVTTQQELQTFDFDYFTISGGTSKYTNTVLDIEHTANFTLRYVYNGVSNNISIDKNWVNINTNENTWEINIPYNALTNNVVIKNGNTFSYYFTYDLYGVNTISITIDGVYDLTTEQETNINEENNKQLLGQLESNQQQTNEKLDELNLQQQETNNSINNMNNSITNSDIDDIDSSMLPSDSTNDITTDGVNGIFSSIYNAFCVGDARNINFPIPNTNKEISLSPSYVYDNLSNFGGGWLVVVIQAFWWYLISRFIIKDVMDKINKIKSGNIENIETSNIRGDML